MQYFYEIMFHMITLVSNMTSCLAYIQSNHIFSLFWSIALIFSWQLLIAVVYFFRIRQEHNGGAWCPKQQISHDVYEWLQVDLLELKVITLVETQGRFGNGQVSGPQMDNI